MKKEPRKEILIRRSRTTGWWVWEVSWYDNEGTWITGTMGYASSKKEARIMAKNADIPRGNHSKKALIKKTFIEPPFVDAEVVNGYLCSFSMYSANMEKVKFSTSEISDNTAYWVFGLDCFEPDLSERSEQVIAMLKIWGVYRGGKDKKSILKTNNLSERDYNIIADKLWNEIKIEYDEGYNMHWTVTV